MEKFYDTITREYEPTWVIFSIIKELYTNNMDCFTRSEDSKTTFYNIRGFLIKDRFISTKIYPDILPITTKQYNLMIHFKSLISEIPKVEYESYILYVSYLKYILVENLKDIVIDFINFDGISEFIITIELLQKHRLSPTLIKEIFGDVIYASIKNEVPKQIYPLVQKVFASSTKNKLVHMTKKLKDFENLINESPLLTMETDDIILEILNHTSTEYIVPSIIDLKEMSFNLVSASQKINKELKVALKEQIVPVILQLPRLMCNSYLNLLFKIREYGGTKITTQNKNFCLFIDNQRVQPLGVNLQWFETIRCKRKLENEDEYEE